MINALIIEDEAPAADRLKKLMMEVDPFIRILDIVDSVSAAKRWLREHPQPDLMMVDIQLADGLSFEIFQEISIESFVIFTTAYDKYAIRAFELNSIDYLLKPVDQAKLANAIHKLRKIRGQRSGIDIQSIISAMDHQSKRFKERFAIPVGNSIRSIKTSDIAFFYLREKCVFLCTDEGRHFPLEQSLDKLEDLLDPDRFFRISRQYMISYHAIKKIHILSKSRVSLETIPALDEALLVSTARTHLFRKWLDR